MKDNWGRAVREVLEKHDNMSLRGAMVRTGIDHVTISKMAAGFVPRSETVMRFAAGFGLDVNEWLELAGYERLPPTDEDAATEATMDGADAFLEGFRQLQEDYAHLRFPLPSFKGGVRSIKGPDEAREILESLRQDIEQGHFGDPRPPKT